MSRGEPKGEEILFATTNMGKVRELRDLLSCLNIRIISAADLSGFSPAEETGETFEANAVLKARSAALFSGMPALADDSGLEVDALGGRPGVQSARYSGPGADDFKNTALLLKNLAHVPPSKRTAGFRCVMAFFDPAPTSGIKNIAGKGCFAEHQNSLHVVSGECRGYILEKPRGRSGFGYDPVFYYPAYGKTFAELDAGVKNKISHRAYAVKKMVKYLELHFSQKHLLEK